ncbi:isoprenylcysteine carboxylmethyltransferase family protein [uncultured Sneathiella sp.]|uniref:methyltransferase family protein n=1 Tax=uncultured Sneathiella sp. TaxID=879315 RepID=UPI0030DC976C|tara:strand:+ start:96 stop:560 length:465 start_codon:yes stop_codon:yes gene_type:complete
MSKPDHAGVRIPPPLCFFTFLAVGILANSAWVEGRLAANYLTISGALIAAASFVYLVLAAQKHRSAGSNVEPWKPTTTIISDGAYKYSRNPIYLAMAVFYVGAAIAAGSWLALLLLPACLYIIRHYVIAREEAYLEDKFGSEYLDYKKKVRRWI